jgi:hypothetical protein
MKPSHRAKSAFIAATVCVACRWFVMPVHAQLGADATAPRPSGRVSVYTNASRAAVADGASRDFLEISTAATYSLPERDSDGLVYGFDLRHSRAGNSRADRLSVYEMYAGARAAGGRLMLRWGHIWLNDLGGLGALAGGAVEVRSRPAGESKVSAVRAGAFAGLEPNVFLRGYAPGIFKYGAYVAFDGERARRQTVGIIAIKHESALERSVISASNVLPIGSKLFVYQAAEIDMSAPGGRARRGLNYFLTNTRFAPNRRVDVQGTFSRGRSIDARGISEDSLNGRSISPAALEGFLYESAGGRVSVEVAPGVRIHGAYARDRNNRDDDASGRITIGGYAGNVGGWGFDVSASDSRVHRASGPYHSRYVSVGRQVGRDIYVSGDISTSLAVLRFSRSDDVIVELRPRTTRVTGSAVINIGRATSLHATVDRTVDEGATDLRLVSGIIYRLR